jgi:hypothetical protein
MQRMIACRFDWMLKLHKDASITFYFIPGAEGGCGQEIRSGAREEQGEHERFGSAALPFQQNNERSTSLER